MKAEEGERWISVDDLPTILPATSPNGRTSGWEPVNLAELPERPPQEPNLGELGIAYPGKRHVFSGPQESAKTLCAYVLGLAVIRAGGSFCLIDFEMGSWDARTRLQELGATKEELASILYFEPYQPITPSIVIGILTHQPSLVMVDAAAGAYQAQELDDNKRSDVERFTAAYVHGFWRAGVATVVIDHVVKSAEARGNYAIGSERKVGGADVHLGFSVVTPIKRGTHGLYKITTHKDRGGFLKRGKLADFELSSDPDTHLITWAFKRPLETDEEHPFRPTGIMEKVSRFLEVQQGSVSMNTLKTAKLGKHEYVDLALSILCAEAFVEESAGAHRARMFESMEPYREASDTSPRLRPDFAPEPGITSSPLRPSPYGGGEAGEFAPKGEDTSPQTFDDIPF